jgi:hypothetical protein
MMTNHSSLMKSQTSQIYHEKQQWLLHALLGVIIVHNFGGGNCRLIIIDRLEPATRRKMQ